MEVLVHVPAALRDLVGGLATVTVDVPAAPATVGAALDALARGHPALERRVRDEQGRVRRHVNLFVGDDNVRDLDGPATAIPTGSALTIIPAVSGGCG